MQQNDDRTRPPHNNEDGLTPDSSRAARWYSHVRLNRTPICPLCAEPLDPDAWSSYRTLAMHGPCASRAAQAEWPSPYLLTEVVNPADVMLYVGIIFYSPRDLLPEPMLARFFRRLYAAGRTP